MSNINKSDMIAEIAKETRYKKSVIEDVLNVLIAKIPQFVANGNIVQFEGFGSFDKKLRPKRNSYDFLNEKPTMTPEKTIPVFRPGANFIRIVAESEVTDT